MNNAGRARNARLNQALSHAVRLVELLTELQGRTRHQHVDDKDAWFEARSKVELLTQCFHEANAYNNITKQDTPQ